MSVVRWIDAYRRRHGIDAIVDDVTVEDRFPNVKWISEPTLRAMQRKAFLLAEWGYAHPEATAALDAEEDRRARAQSGPPRVAAPSRPPAQADDEWEGIERTMPRHVARGRS